MTADLCGEPYDLFLFPIIAYRLYQKALKVYTCPPIPRIWLITIQYWFITILPRNPVFQVHVHVALRKSI